MFCPTEATYCISIAGVTTTFYVPHLPVQQSFSSSKTAAAVVAVGHTRPGSASLYALLIGVALEPFGHALDFVVFEPTTT